MGRDVFVPRGQTNVRPLGKSNLSWQDFAAGVSTTHAHRVRAGGANRANPSERSVRQAVLWHADDPQRVAGATSRGAGRTSPGRNSK